MEGEAAVRMMILEGWRNTTVTYYLYHYYRWRYLSLHYTNANYINLLEGPGTYDHCELVVWEEQHGLFPRWFYACKPPVCQPGSSGEDTA